MLALSSSSFIYLFWLGSGRGSEDVVSGVWRLRFTVVSWHSDGTVVFKR